MFSTTHILPPTCNSSSYGQIPHNHPTPETGKKNFLRVFPTRTDNAIGRERHAQASLLAFGTAVEENVFLFSLCFSLISALFPPLDDKPRQTWH